MSQGEPNANAKCVIPVTSITLVHAPSVNKILNLARNLCGVF